MHKIRTRSGKMKKALYIFVLVWVAVLSLSFPQKPAQGVEDNYLYAVALGQPGKVLKVNLNTFQIVDTMVFNEGENGAHAVDITDEYLYVGLLGSRPAKIIKIRLSDFTRASDVTLPSGFEQTTMVHIFGNYLYATFATGQAAKLDANSLDLVDYAESPGRIPIFDAIQVGDYLYLSANQGTPAYLLKLRVNDLTQVSSLQLSLEQSGRMAYIDNYLYVVSNAVPAGLVKIDLDTFQEVASVQFLTGDGKGDADLVVRYDDYLLTNGDSFPGRVYRTGLSDFTYIDYINLSDNKSCGLALFGKYLYVSMAVKPASIIKVDLDTFKEVAKLSTGEVAIPQMATASDIQEVSENVVGAMVLVSILIGVCLYKVRRNPKKASKAH